MVVSSRLRGAVELAEVASSLKPALLLPARNGADVTIVTVCTNDTRGFHGRGQDILCSCLRRNVRSYAMRHGYGAVIFDSNPATPRHVLWSKIPALYYVLQELNRPYVWWHDADSMFVDVDRSLEGFKPAPQSGSVGGHPSLTIAGDTHCFINIGHMMLRRSAWVKHLLTEVWEKGLPPLGPQPWEWPDQAMMVFLLSGSPDRCRQHVKDCCTKPEHVDSHVDLRPSVLAIIPTSVPG
jgi:hypothetical protein